MNYFELINSILEQLDLPQIEAFEQANLPVHTKIMSYINRANKEILTCNKWHFNTKKALFSEHEIPSFDRIELNDLVRVIDGETLQFELLYQNPDMVVDEYGQFKTDFEDATDKSIIPEPFGSELITYFVCLEINQEPNNPKYVHWKQRYNKAYAELCAAEKRFDGKPVFRLIRG